MFTQDAFGGEVAALFTTSAFRFPASQRSPWQRYGMALLAVSLAVGIRYALGFFFPGLTGASYVLMFPAVLFSVWYGGLGPGLFATFISLLATDYLLIPPLFHFSKPWSFL